MYLLTQHRCVRREEKKSEVFLNSDKKKPKKQYNNNKKKNGVGKVYTKQDPVSIVDTYHL